MEAGIDRATASDQADALRRLLELLELEELDTDLYRAQNPVGISRMTLYGGQVAAQALRAAGLTVPEGRRPHSLHGYFLRPGRADHPVILQVNRDRDGRSFSARQVNAVQLGSVIFSMSASFHADEVGVSYDARQPPGPADPEQLPAADRSEMFWDGLDLRVLPSEVGRREEGSRPTRLWARTTGALPDDPMIHACLLTYFSDSGSGFGSVKIEGLPSGGPSLDHAMWFHRPVRIDRWVQLTVTPLAASGGRGLYTGVIYDQEDTPCITLSQEMLLRS